MEETKEKLREEWVKNNITLVDFLVGQGGKREAVENLFYKAIPDYWFSKLDTYADTKINLIFAQEANRNNGMIKVRGENGVGFIKK
mgnify:CR=1